MNLITVSSKHEETCFLCETETQGLAPNSSTSCVLYLMSAYEQKDNISVSEEEQWDSCHGRKLDLQKVLTPVR